MLKKALFVAVLVVAVCSFGVINVFASGEDHSAGCTSLDSAGNQIAVFCDGRINNYDMTESVAVYYTRSVVQSYDDDGVPYWTEQIDGIQLWGIDGDSVGQLVLNVPLSRIESAMLSSQDVQIAANGAYSLNYSPSSNSFWVTGPNGYSFSWTAW